VKSPLGFFSHQCIQPVMLREGAASLQLIDAASFKE